MASNEVVQEEIQVVPQKQSRLASFRLPYILLLSAIVLILVGGVIANATQTVGGQVAVREVNFAATNGVMMNGLLYVPRTATSKTPACGVVAIHGYINSRDTMDGFAIEMSRRGCVVLAVDQTGHGYSDPPAFANGYGGPDALAYLDSLSIVRKNDIGLIGHSMGGWASVAAAATYPADYRSLVLVSSSTSTPPLEPVPGTPTFPKNVKVVEARYSEFSTLMWAVPVGGQFPESKRMQALFGTPQTIQVGHLYGSIADGTARQLALVSTTHPGLTFSTEGVGEAVSWMQQTLDGVSPLAASDQIWLWDEIGTLLALVGVILLLFPVGFFLLRTPFFSSLVRGLPTPRPLRGIGWWIGVALTIVIAVFSFYPFQNFGSTLLPASPLFPQTITTGVMVWAVGGAIIAFILFLLWHLGSNRRQGASLANYGITAPNNAIEWGNIGKAVLFAISVLVPSYLALALLEWAFNTDARIWVVSAKIITPYHVPIILAYLIPFALYFLMLSINLHGELRSTRLSVGREIAKNIVILVIGFVGFLLVEYIPLLSGGTLATPDQPLLSIVAFQFVAFYIIIAAISTYFFYKTGRIYAGAFINALFLLPRTAKRAGKISCSSFFKNS